MIAYLPSGRRLDVFDPRPDDWCVEDLGHVLARLVRYHGTTSWSYTVAQHCVLLAGACSGEMARQAIVHEAGEMAINDIPSPVKYLSPEIVAVEERLLESACEAFGVAYPMPPELADLDRRLRVDECRALLPRGADREIAPGLEPLGVEIEKIGTRQARRAFLEAARKLGVG